MPSLAHTWSMWALVVPSETSSASRKYEVLGADELGGICAFQYNSGGNLGECMVFGKIAGTNATTEKGPLPALVAPAAVDADIKFQSGSMTDLGVASDDSAYEVGENQCIGGKIVVLTYADGTIQDVEVLEQNETPEFGGAALEGPPEMQALL